jgi:hypothetical protein
MSWRELSPYAFTDGKVNIVKSLEAGVPRYMIAVLPEFPKQPTRSWHGPFDSPKEATAFYRANTKAILAADKNLKAT